MSGVDISDGNITGKRARFSSLALDYVVVDTQPTKTIGMNTTNLVGCIDASGGVAANLLRHTYTKVGNFVSIELPSFRVDNLNTVDFINTGLTLPVGYRPARSVWGVIFLADQGAGSGLSAGGSPVAYNISTAGVIQLCKMVNNSPVAISFADNNLKHFSPVSGAITFSTA